MFSADQIAVPPELAPILRQYTKAVLRHEAGIAKLGLSKWTSNYFAELGGLAKVFSDDGVLQGAGDVNAVNSPGTAVQQNLKDSVINDVAAFIQNTAVDGAQYALFFFVVDVQRQIHLRRSSFFFRAYNETSNYEGIKVTETAGIRPETFLVYPAL